VLSTDSVEKLASKISRLSTPKILPVTVRFGEPASFEFASNRTLVVVVKSRFQLVGRAIEFFNRIDP